MLVHYSNFTRQKLKTIRQYKGKDKGTFTYYEPSFYDSETSKETYYTIDGYGKKVEQLKETWVYIWAFSVGNVVYYGRELSEFIDFIKTLVKEYELNSSTILKIYVHNLAYDISYLYPLLKELDDSPQLLAIAPNRPFNVLLSCGIQFMCSFKLSNRSLDKWCKDLNVAHKKLTGTKDYNTTYKPCDSLPDNEYLYLEHDILSLKECFYREIELQGYNFVTVPMTSTGFVRKIFQRAYKKNYYTNVKIFKATKPTANQYNRLVACAMGGMTQGNIRALGVKVTHDRGIGHRDFDSHYPTQQVCKKFPMSCFTPLDVRNGVNNDSVNLNTLTWYIRHGYYFVCEIECKGTKIKKGVTAPFMCKSKVNKTATTTIYHYNGKIVGTNPDGVLNMTITNFDYQIFREQYTFTGIKILALDVYTTDYLPSYVRDTVLEKYKGKNELKDITKANPTEENELNLLLCKNQLNGIFGCTYTRIVREENTLSLDDYQWSTTLQDTEDRLQKYYDNNNSCLSFAWGCFTTAMARAELYHCIKLIGYDNFLYCDTDSIFYKISDDTERACEEYNKECLEDSVKNGFFIEYEIDGQTKRKYLHKFDTENDHGKSKTFKCMHAKCYALEPNGQLEITVAGVTKHQRTQPELTREDELGSIDNFVDGFTFTECGGTRAVYNTHEYEYNQELGVWTGGGCAILDTEKTIHNVVFNEFNLLEWVCD